MKKLPLKINLSGSEVKVKAWERFRDVEDTQGNSLELYMPLLSTSMCGSITPEELCGLVYAELPDGEYKLLTPDELQRGCNITTDEAVLGHNFLTLQQGLTDNNLVAEDEEIMKYAEKLGTLKYRVNIRQVLNQLAQKADYIHPPEGEEDTAPPEEPVVSEEAEHAHLVALETLKLQSKPWLYKKPVDMTNAEFDQTWEAAKRGEAFPLPPLPKENYQPFDLDESEKEEEPEEKLEAGLFDMNKAKSVSAMNDVEFEAHWAEEKRKANERL